MKARKNKIIGQQTQNSHFQATFSINVEQMRPFYSRLAHHPISLVKTILSYSALLFKNMI